MLDGCHFLTPMNFLKLLFSLLWINKHKWKPTKYYHNQNNDHEKWECIYTLWMFNKKKEEKRKSHYKFWFELLCMWMRGCVEKPHSAAATAAAATINSANSRSSRSQNREQWINFDVTVICNLLFYCCFRCQFLSVLRKNQLF